MNWRGILALGWLGVFMSGSVSADWLVPFGGQAGSEVDVFWSGGGPPVESLLFSDPRFEVENSFRQKDRVWPERWRETNRFRVKIPKTVPPGDYEVRGIRRNGMTRAVRFWVSGLGGQPEIGMMPESDGLPVSAGFDQWVNGAVKGEEIDRFQICVEKGQRILVEAKSPWFWAADYPLIWVSDPGGNLLKAGAPLAGEEIRLDFVAGETAVYDLHVTSQRAEGQGAQAYRFRSFSSAWVDGVSPLAGAAGKRETFELFGRNLPSPGVEIWDGVAGRSFQTRRLDQALPQGRFAGSGWIGWTAVAAEGMGPAEVAYAEDVVAETEGKGVQRITVPSAVTGSFNFPGDSDAFRFAAEAGRWYQVEAVSRGKLDESLPRLVVQRVVPGKWQHEDFQVVPTQGTVWAWRDGRKTVGQEFRPEEPGDWLTWVSDRAGERSPGHHYALSVRLSEPGFHLFAEAKTGVLRAGGRTGLRVRLRRQGGWKGAVELEARGLPPGVTALPCVLWSHAEQGWLILEAEPSAPEWRGWVQVLGRDASGGAGFDVAKDEETGGKMPIAVLPRDSGDGGPFLEVQAGDAVVREGGEMVLPFSVRRGSAVSGLPVRVRVEGAGGTTGGEEIVLPGGKDEEGFSIKLFPGVAEDGAPREGTVMVVAEIQVANPESEEKREVWMAWREQILAGRQLLETEVTAAAQAVGVAESAWAEAARKVSAAESTGDVPELEEARVEFEAAGRMLEEKRAALIRAHAWVKRSWEAEQEISGWLDKAEEEAGRTAQEIWRFWSRPVRVTQPR